MAARGHSRPAHCTCSAPDGHWDFRTSRSVSVHRLLAPNSADPAWARFCTNRQGQNRAFMAQSLIKKERREKPYIPGRSSGRPTAAPTIRSPDSTSLCTASARPIARHSTHPHPTPPTPTPVCSTPPNEQDSSPEPGGTQLHSTKQSNQLAVARQMPL